MQVDLQEFVGNKVIGNIRSGTKGEKNEPKKLSHFDVHLDKSTSALAVEIFNQKYNEPKKLKIRFLSQHPMEIYLQRYEGKVRRCYGNYKQAKLMGNDGKMQIIPCNEKECPYRKQKRCKVAARLYFLLAGLEDDGIWCYPIGSENGITNIARRIAWANKKGLDLTKDWYELFLREEDAPTKGKNYIPDIKPLEAIQQKTPEKPENTNKVSKNKNYLMIISMKKLVQEGRERIRIEFKDTSLKEHELFILPEGKREILKLKPGSIIEPVSIENKILKDYRIIKDTGKEQNKKAS